jgi:glucose-6-phosphate-specific signal transduction histidine kinase
MNLRREQRRLDRLVKKRAKADRKAATKAARRAKGQAAASGAEPASRGHGLVGMRERVAALGGTLDAGWTPDGGFQVKAVLPLPEQPPEP